MSGKVIASVVAVGLLPGAIRICTRSRNAEARLGANPLRGLATNDGVCIQIALGLFGAGLLAVTIERQATATGLTAQNILTPHSQW